MKPELKEGETYVGRINDEYIILLPDDNDDANWQAQMDWAKSIGGDLPTRIEQAMLWANHKDQFEEDIYWSCETHQSTSGHAWCQDFDDGTQNYDRKTLELRARAVRRVAVGETK